MWHKSPGILDTFDRYALTLSIMYLDSSRVKGLITSASVGNVNSAEHSVSAMVNASTIRRPIIHIGGIPKKTIKQS